MCVSLIKANLSVSLSTVILLHYVMLWPRWCRESNKQSSFKELGFSGHYLVSSDFKGLTGRFQDVLSSQSPRKPTADSLFTNQSSDVNVLRVFSNLYCSAQSNGTGGFPPSQSAGRPKAAAHRALSGSRETNWFWSGLFLVGTSL